MAGHEGSGRPRLARLAKRGGLGALLLGTFFCVGLGVTAASATGVMFHDHETGETPTVTYRPGDGPRTAKPEVGVRSIDPPTASGGGGSSYSGGYYPGDGSSSDSTGPPTALLGGGALALMLLGAVVVVRKRR